MFVHDEWFPGADVETNAQMVQAKLTLEQEVKAKLWL